MRSLARLSRHVLLILLAAGSASALAQTAVQSQFETGRQAFQAGHYREAVRAFEQARDAGMNTPALWYNLGVCYYRLGEYDKSESAFRRTARFKAMAPAAYYNLGLIELRRERTEQARSWFERARDNTQDAKLRTLASHMLERIARGELAQKAWTGILYAGLGHDDNVTLENTALAQATGKSDTYAELFASTRGVLSGARRDGVLLKANAYRLSYNNQTQFDMTVLTAGLYRTKPIGDWDGEAGAYYTHSTLGGHGYLGMTSLSLQATNYPSRTTRLRIRYRYHHESALDSRYNYLDGNVHDLRAEGRWLLDNGRRLRAYYRLEIENRSDLRTATTFTSVSPTRHTAHVDLTVPVAEGWDVNAMAEYRRSRYADANVLTTGQSIRREDDRARARLRLTRQFNPRTALELQYTYTDNSSNIATYTYSRHVVSAALQYLF